MKKIFLLIAILTCCGMLFAQKGKKLTSTAIDNESRQIYIGSCFGPTVDWLQPVTQAFTGKVAKAGFITGVLVEPALVTERFLYLSTGILVRYLMGDASFFNHYKINGIPINTFATRHYETAYLTLPTIAKFRTPPLKNCVFTGKLGLYHNFKIAGKQYDSFVMDEINDDFFTTTKKSKNFDTALFAEAGCMGIGFEYTIGKSRAFANLDYSCQFNYFNANAKSNLSEERFKTVVHSLQIVLGFLF
jgi:hypothetical protein